MQTEGMPKSIRLVFIASLLLLFTLASSSAAFAATVYVTQKAQITTARITAQSGVVSGKIYVLGGSNNFDPVIGPAAGNLDTVESYDPPSNTWQTEPSMIEPRVLGGSVTSASGNAIYIFGGWNSTTSGSVTNSVLAYTPGSGNGGSIVGAMQHARAVAPAVRLGNLVYIIGGEGSPSASTTMDVYDLNTDSSTSINLPSGMSIDNAGAVGYGGKVYIIGGWDLNNGGNPTNACWEYDPAQTGPSAFTPLNNMPVALASAGPKSVFCDSANGKIYVVSGATLDRWSWPNIGPVAYVLEYDISSDTWNVVGSVPGTRGGAILEGVVNGGNYEAYLISGCDVQFNPLNTNEKIAFAPASNYQALISGQGEVTCNCNGNVISAIMPLGTTSGMLGVAISETGPPIGSGVVPASPYYDISTSSVFSGNIVITLPYTPSGSGTPMIYHWNGNTSSWDALTTTVNTSNNTVTATTSSLSPFIVVYPADSGSSSVPVSSTWSLGLMVLAALTILAMRLKAKKA